MSQTPLSTIAVQPRVAQKFGAGHVSPDAAAQKIPTNSWTAACLLLMRCGRAYDCNHMIEIKFVI